MATGQIKTKINQDIIDIYPVTKIANVEGLQTALNGKVDTVSGKNLSTNDYTTAEKNKLAGIADGATANVGTVTQVKVGSTAYNPTSGIISLPAYPTDTDTHRPIKMNDTEILGNNTTALNLKAGSNVSLSNSSGTVTISATDTTYSAATQSAAGLMSAADKLNLDMLGLKIVYDGISGSSKTHRYSLKTTDFYNDAIGTYLIMVTSWAISPVHCMYALSYSGGNFDYYVFTKVFGTDNNDVSYNSTTHQIEVTSSGRVTIYALR